MENRDLREGRSGTDPSSRVLMCLVIMRCCAYRCCAWQHSSLDTTSIWHFEPFGRTVPEIEPQKIFVMISFEPVEAHPSTVEYLRMDCIGPKTSSIAMLMWSCETKHLTATAVFKKR